jgi:microcystin-dependent protein
MSNSEVFFIDGTMGFKSKLIFGLISLNPVAIGTIDYPELQADCAIAIGDHAGFYNQGECAIAIGESAGRTDQSSLAIAIGSGAGESSQSQYAIALGLDAGMLTQGTNAIAIGSEAGNSLQGESAIAIGKQAGSNIQQDHAIALGSEAGRNNQSSNAIAIGHQAGYTNQNSNAVALGFQTGFQNQGENAIAIGKFAGYSNQPPNSIVLNASGSTMANVTQSSACYVHPIRPNTSSSYASNNLLYDTTTREVVYQPNPVVVGDIKFSAQGSDHNNWLLCNGRSLLVADYPALHAVIEYKFGGTGASFNVPDARSRVLGAIGQGSGLSDRTLGQAVGTETHTLTVNEIPSHNHGITDPGHSHSLPITSEGFADIGPDDDVTQGSGFNSGTSTTGITINNTGGGQAHNNMQPTLFIGNVFIYAGY